MNWDCSHHAELTPNIAASYCFVLSGAFVGCLYIAPKKIRVLSRDDARQIRWRTVTSALMCTLSIASYPLLFCKEDLQASRLQLPAILDIRRDSRATVGVLTHVALLYLGPLSEMGSMVYVALRRDDCLSLKTYLKCWFSVHMAPILQSFFSPSSESDRWIRLRNLVVAPCAEELVFRMLMVPALYATGVSPLKVALVAPLFFGVAHAHHAILSLRNREPIRNVVVRTLFQFTYTSLFGSYAAYAFLKTGSIVAVAACHSFCNSMGLPSLSFVQRQSPLYPYRFYLWAAHFGGILFFSWGFRSSFLLPPSGGLAV